MWTGVRYGTGETRSRRPRRAMPCRKSGEGDPYKPKAKADRAGRESEGFIVPMGRLHLPVKPAKAGGGKEPCFGYGRVWR